MFIIYSTFLNKEKAVEVGKKLLEDKLIGCFNVFPIISGYWWKGEMVEDEEVGVIF
ncbi:MAG: divalent-cation tolerance protein CutA, partial [Thermotoga sp.]